MRPAHENMRPIQILLIEDNPADIELVKESIFEARILADVEVATDGEAALKMLEDHRPDMVLLDLGLPKISGREVLQFIKGHPILKLIPVIVLTGSAAEVDVVRSYKLGANSYIVKPVTASQFLDVITSFGSFWLDVVELPPRGYVKEHERELKALSSGEARRALPPFAGPRKIDVLMIEDSEPDAELVRVMLEETSQGDIRLAVAATLDEGLKAIEKRKFDALLLDLSLPDALPGQTLQSILSKFPDLPIVVVTGHADSEAAVRAVHQGAQDYLVKGEFEAEVLRRSIQYAIERKGIEKERSAALLSAIRSREEAERALWNRDDFISIAAHELRTPLTSLLLQTQLLIDQLNSKKALPPLPQLQKSLRTYDREVERLKVLINSLLDVTRISSGKMFLSPGPCNLSELSRTVVQDIEFLLTRAGCRVSIVTQPDVVGNWDCIRLEQVLTNLLTNAAKYAKGADVTVEVARKEDTAILRVADRGPGIAPENVPRLFTRFERFGATADSRGLGLGLYISRQIVDAHGGSIHVSSELGRGTTFEVSLPIRTQAKLAA